MGVSLPQLALAWLLARGDNIIPGSRNRERVAQNLAATELTLSDADLALIDDIAPEGGVEDWTRVPTAPLRGGRDARRKWGERPPRR